MSESEVRRRGGGDGKGQVIIRQLSIYLFIYICIYLSFKLDIYLSENVRIQKIGGERKEGDR